MTSHVQVDINPHPVWNGSYPIDTTLQLTGSFAATLTGQLGDPETVTLFLQPPSGPQQTYSTPGGQSSGGINFVSIGVYSFVLTPNQSGDWEGTWQGQGILSATRDFKFVVWQSTQIPG